MDPHVTLAIHTVEVDSLGVKVTMPESQAAEAFQRLSGLIELGTAAAVGMVGEHYGVC